MQNLRGNVNVGESDTNLNLACILAVVVAPCAFQVEISLALQRML